MTLNTQRGPWKIDYDMAEEALHVRPRADAMWHPLEAACRCLPASEVAEVRDGYGTPVHLPVYFHVAQDGRTVPAPRPGC